MNFAARTVLVVLAAALTVVVVWAASRIRTVADVNLPPEPPPERTHPAGIKGQFVGTAGCLGAACHGAPAGNTLAGKFDNGTWQSSGSCWVAADPHTAAYSLLTDHPHRPVKVTAAHIMARYAKDTPGARATDDARCLACHTNPTLAAGKATPELVALRAEGVSCEACHGNAGGWLHRHTTWKGDRAKDYDDTGMVKLHDVGERAVTCAGCHVGAPAEGGLPVRDMNHDMIAAGHPRLNFDFAEYQRRLPVHWLEKDRTAQGNVARGPEWELKAWLVGRVAHAEAACKLLESRAARAQDANEKRTPWPEFAEFNCAACHHDLPADWRGKVLGDRPLGTPPWQAVWPVAPAIGLDPQRPKGLFAGAKHNPEPALDALLRAVQTPRPALAAQVRPHATEAARALRELRLELGARPDGEFVRTANAAFTNPGADARDWDSGLQVLFGLAALERTRPRDEARDRLFRDAFNAYRATGAPESQRWPKVTDAVRALHPKK